MTDRKKKAIDYLNSNKVKRNVGEWILLYTLICAGVFFGILAIIEIIK